LIPLDIKSASENYRWRNSFFWPINSISLINIRKDFEKKLLDTINTENDEIKKSILRIIFNFLVREYILKKELEFNS